REFGDRNLAEPGNAAKDDLVWFAAGGHRNGGHERRLPRRAVPVCSGVEAAYKASSICTSPCKRLAALRSIMTWASLCLRVQAAVWVTPSRRPSSMLEMPFLDWVSRYMALNQRRSGSLLE